MSKTLLKDYHTGSGLKLSESAINQQYPGVLCTLEGPLASYVVPTRNTRLYPRPLWERVLHSDYVKEMLDTLTFYGEADHPFRWEERLEIHIPNVAINVRKLWLDDTKGVVMGIVDVLDTPNGKILKTMVDYGSTLGISSRGTGNVIDVDGKPVVDADTYNFVTFDIVPMPGNKSARLSTQETVEVPEIATNESISMVEAITLQVNEAIDKKDVNTLQSMNVFLEYSNIDGQFDTLTETISKVLNGSKVTETDTINPATEDLLEAYALVSELESKVELLESENASKDVTISELNDQSLEFRNTISELNEAISQSEELITSYTELLNEYRSDNVNLSKMIDTVKESYESKVSELIESLSKKESEYNELREEATESAFSVSKLESKIDKLIAESESKVAELTKEHSDALSECKSMYSKKLKEYKAKVSELTESLNSLSSKSDTFLNEYVKLRCNSLGLNESMVLSNVLLESVSTPDQVDDQLRGLMKKSSSVTKGLYAEPVTSGARVVSYDKHRVTIEDLNESAKLSDLASVVSSVRRHSS